MGQLLEDFFPRQKVRYIALNDAVDSEVENEITPFRSLLNEMYSRDVSKKVHSSYLTKAKSGKFTGCLAPFGYRKDPEDKNHLLIDEDTAWIVRRIFEWAKNGSGPNRIRRRLEDEEIPCPAWWNRQKGLRDHVTKFERENPERGRFIWDFTAIQGILANPVYIGAIASQRSITVSKSAGWATRSGRTGLSLRGCTRPSLTGTLTMLYRRKSRAGNARTHGGISVCSPGW